MLHQTFTLYTCGASVPEAMLTSLSTALSSDADSVGGRLFPLTHVRISSDRASEMCMV